MKINISNKKRIIASIIIILTFIIFIYLIITYQKQITNITKKLFVDFISFITHIG